MPEFTSKQREKLAEENEAMPDGSYPIRNVADLKRAIQAFGRSKNPEKTKAWIKKRARELDAEDLIPESWTEEAKHFDDSAYLVHYGVLGMKWGVRRNRKNARYAQAYSVGAAVDLHNKNPKAAKRNYTKAVYFSNKSKKQVDKLLNKYGDKLYSEIEKLPSTEQMGWFASPEYMTSHFYNALNKSKK